MIASEPEPLPLQVLLAEDDADMRRLLAGWLRREGYRVHTVADGGELTRELARHAANAPDAIDVDVVISDIRMPGPSGLDALLALRERDRATPVILITAFGDRSVHDEARRLGAHVLDKPFAASDLRACMTALIQASLGCRVERLI